MALKSETTCVDDRLGLRVEGDLGDFQIVEEKSDSEDDDKTYSSSRTVDTLDTIPSSLVRPSNSPICGNVAVTNSENIVIGNNTYFNGPVVIKQVIQNASGLENPSYVKSENEDTVPEQKYQEHSKNDKAVRQFHLRKWHKITFSAVCIVILGGIFAILSIILTNSSQDDSSSGTDENSSSNSGNSLLIAPDHLRIVSRTEWLAQPVEDPLDKIRQPVPWVIISHTATESCKTQSECVYRVRLIQMFHVESRKWSDIGYNFLVAGDGSAYFGRGWDYIGAHTLGYNKYSIGISFIGTFNNDPPPKKQIDACLKLLKRGVDTGKLAKDYKLFAHRQLASTLSPGDKLYDIIKEWPHFVSNFSDPSELLPNYT
nr:peptidoglycan-recognition protein LE-like isoform X2 [Helicoverpa armigera]